MTYAEMSKEKMYAAWLDYEMPKGAFEWQYGEKIYVEDSTLLKDKVVHTALQELKQFMKRYMNLEMQIAEEMPKIPFIEIRLNQNTLEKEGYLLQASPEKLQIVGSDAKGILYGVFKLIFSIKQHQSLQNLSIKESPSNELRMINHWDNVDGSIERGYAGRSIFYKDNDFIKDLRRSRDYARLLASVGINSVSVNNVNVHERETKFIEGEYLEGISRLAEVFADYGIKLFLSINFAAPIELGGLHTADPADHDVQEFWGGVAKRICEKIPNFGGFLVKADSENRPGPFTYNRTHAEGANMLAKALKPYDGIVIWRCFVYNCHVDWRDRKTDRARAAYDHFIGLDGLFEENVILQIKNGPMDFQIREPLSPLFGALTKTNQMMEFQITQEYTGQQKHICFLPTMWREYLDFDTYAKGKGTYIRDIVSGKTYDNIHGGIAGVSNIGESVDWTGNPLAAANLYGFGRLCWNNQISTEEIAEEWVTLTLGTDKAIKEHVKTILLQSRKAYEDYTVPLGIGWMVNIGHHYGPNIEGYEYSPWGTYHYADYKGIGVDRTSETGTGYVNQYFEPNRSLYNNREMCPEALLLFFHHVGYEEKLKDGRTLLQYIYDVHFEGVASVEKFTWLWQQLEGHVENHFYNKVKEGLEVQLHDAAEWRDIVNTYFYRKTGIKDARGRKIYE